MSDDRKVRAAVRTAMLEGGTPAAQVDEVVDLGFHAADCAIASLLDVVRRTPDQRVYMAAMACAIGLAASKLSTMEDGLKEIAGRYGLPTAHVRVQVQP